MTQIANNYITLPRTRTRRYKNRWAYIGAAAVVCGILGVYGVSKAHAQIDMPYFTREHIFEYGIVICALQKTKEKG